MATLVVDQGLDAARTSLTDLYRRAGFTLRSTAPDLVNLTSAADQVTIALAAYDHSPTQTQVVVHLSAG
jgi:hypothetical protein